MKKKIVIVASVAVLAGTAWFLFFTKKPQMPQMPPAMVTLTEVQQKEIVEVQGETARVVAKDEVDLIPHVEGYLEKKYFTDEAMVKKGDLLFLIDLAARGHADRVRHLRGRRYLGCSLALSLQQG